MNSTRMYKANVKSKSGSIDEYLVYEKKSSFGVEYIDMSEDLLERCIGGARSFCIDEIGILVPLIRILDLNNRVSIRSVLKRYYEDLHSLLSVQNLYIGNIGIVTNHNVGELPNSNLTIESFLYNRLLQKIDHHFLDLVDYMEYDCIKSLNIGDICVLEEKPFTKVFQDKIQSVEIQKKKVLEMYHERYQEKR